MGASGWEGSAGPAHQLHEGGDPVEQDAAAEGEGRGAGQDRATRGLGRGHEDHQGVRAVVDRRLVVPPG